jgi:predicted nucleotide-binding protein
MNRPLKTKALDRLQKALTAIPDLQQRRHDTPEFDIWHRNTQVAIANTFGEKSRHVDDFNNINYTLMVLTSSTPDSAFQKAYVRGLQSAASVLQSMIEEVQEYWEEDPEEKARTLSRGTPPISSRNVFIIHGHDEAAKEAIARFISKLGLNPVILHEQPNQGRTIIEKFEDHSEVAYAIALLTPDDVGAAKTEITNLCDRSRQNVIFEFGYFIGKLGRKKVCGITKGSVELPSDYSGVLYIPLDPAGAWRMALVRELRAIGLNVDANLAF